VTAVLVTPSAAYERSVLANVAELIAAGEEARITADTFAVTLARYAAEAAGRELAPDRVAHTELWLVDGDTYIGRTGIRHQLNDGLLREGGHIGYTIRPSMRGRGFGTLILRLALVRAAELGISRALLTCDDDNVPSRRIIEAAGGIPDAPLDPGVLRFWIHTTPDAMVTPTV
jgi:predicted acetyltransferase